MQSTITSLLKKLKSSTDLDELSYRYPFSSSRQIIVDESSVT